MPRIVDILRHDPEPLPEWLRVFCPNFSRENFFSSRSRTLFYPGSGTDGQPIRLCSNAHAVHTFVYVDYGVSAEDIVSEMNEIKGYDIEHLEKLDETLVCPNGWRPRKDLSDSYQRLVLTDPYYLYVVLCRKKNFNKTLGPKKLAILFIGRDGFETFDILYCQNSRRRRAIPKPYLIVVQHTGGVLGGNHDRFENDGLLHQYAKEFNALPKLLLVGKPSTAWVGYQDTGARPITGGADYRVRRLYRLDGSSSF